MALLEGVLDRIEKNEALDAAAQPLAAWVRRRFGGTTMKDAAHGVPLGHPAHPSLVLLPAGAFTGAAVLDLVPVGDRVRDILVATGVVTAVPAAVTGLADWSELRPQQQRVGLVHAGTNGVALLCYSASLVASARGRRLRARSWRMVGLTAITAGGFLGGHLAHRLAVGANHAEETPYRVPAGWHRLCAVDDLPGDGVPARRVLDGVPLLVVREGDRVHVLGEECSHLGGPLADGEVVAADGEACIRCPWHGSTFALEDGRVVQGPATSRQPAFGVRIVEGQVQVQSPVNA